MEINLQIYLRPQSCLRHISSNKQADTQIKPSELPGIILAVITHPLRNIVLGLNNKWALSIRHVDALTSLATMVSAGAYWWPTWVPQIHGGGKFGALLRYLNFATAMLGFWSINTCLLMELEKLHRKTQSRSSERICVADCWLKSSFDLHRTC